MGGNSFGKIFTVTTFGESHGPAIGCVVDGCPSGLELCEDDIQRELDRRKPGQNSLTTQRKEEDSARILSGTFEGKTTGTPITILIENKDHRGADYSNIKDIFRPSHADYTYFKKYGIRDYRGGGRASARETACRVAAGAIAKKMLKQQGIDVVAFVQQMENIAVKYKNFDDVDRNVLESSPIRCPDLEKSNQMVKLIETVKNNGDSIGGIIQCFIKNCPIGLGEPVFDKLSAQLAKAVLSINAAKGFEFANAFDSIYERGSSYNDEFINQDSKITTKTNNSAGIQGGISNGQEINFRVVFKPTPTIFKKQNTVNIHGNEMNYTVTGRHDPCVLPRAVPVVEAMVWLTLADFYLRKKCDRVGVYDKRN